MTNDILGKLKGPAIGLIITGVSNALFGLYLIISNVAQYAMGTIQQDFSSDAERIGFNVGFWGISLLGLISLILAPIIVFGGVKMMKGKSYGFAKATAILAIIPFTSCCFIVGVPFGIWALVVLKSPEVIAFFNGDAPPPQFSPPQPPQNW